MISHYLAAGIGGGLGAMLRVAFTKILPQGILGMPFPILFVNICGCFIMGLFSQFIELHWSPPDYIRYLVISGFLGGFTTFSAFSMEFWFLFSKNQIFYASLYVALSFGLGLLSFFLGVKFIR